MVYNARPRWLSSFMILPGRCLCCGVNTPNHQDLCGECAICLPWQNFCCPRCALPLAAPSESPCGECQRTPPCFDRAMAPFRYTTPINRLINDFKHYDRLAAGRVLGELFCDWLMQKVENEALTKPDYLLPVPLHWSRLWKRGFNQAQWLADDIGKSTGIPVINDGIQRRHTGLAQQALSRRQRQGNLRGAFTINPKRKARLENRHIAIIDDVMTTGTTANEITRLLKENQVAEVSIWAIARTPKSTE